MGSRPELVAIAPQVDLQRHRIVRLPVLVIHAHSSCNCRCVMCDIWKAQETRVLSLGDLELHLDSIRQLGVRWVVFSGGEPLMNRELPVLCARLHQEGIRITLLTTGLLLAKLAAQVAESFDDVIVSIDGPALVHDSIRRVHGGFALIQCGIEALYRLRSTLSITARTTVQKANHGHLRDTVTAAKQLDLKGISFLAADLTSQAFNRHEPWSAARQSEIALSLSELAALESEIDALIHENAADIARGYIAESPQKLRRIARHFGAHLGLEHIDSPPCNAPWTSAVFETDGTLRPCFFHSPIGNLRTASLGDALNSAGALAFRAGLDVASNPTCNRCVCSLNYRD
jgi:Fe-coproporphyrin III synthase